MKILIAMAALLALAPAARAEGPQRIRDNSFLLEEAYNQEPGVIQHIQTYQYMQQSRTWGYTFTDEWPVPGQKHQLSLTLPVNHMPAAAPRVPTPSSSAPARAWPSISSRACR